jgi:hypothetical protein
MSQDVSLMAHLMRRAGFGATRNELDEYLSDGYEATVDKLLDPGESDHMPDDLIRRYHVDQSELRQLDGAGAYWLYRMLTTSNPLEEKLALFWHGLFATGYAKLNQARALLNQIDMFRKYGFGSFRDLLVELSRDPAMILWLDLVWRSLLQTIHAKIKLISLQGGYLSSACGRANKHPRHPTVSILIGQRDIVELDHPACGRIRQGLVVYPPWPHNHRSDTHPIHYE